MSASWVPAAYFAFILSAGAGVAGFVSSAKEGELRHRCATTCLLRPEYAGFDRTAPDFELKNLDGKPVRLSDYRGKVVLLNFWTKTCGPCLEEMPDFAELTRVLRDRSDVAVLTVSADEGPADVADVFPATLRAPKPPFEVLFDPDREVIEKKFGTKLYPETWLIDKDGVIRARFDGARTWSHAAVVEYIDEMRSGAFCPIEADRGKQRGEGSKLCQELGGGN